MAWCTSTPKASLHHIISDLRSLFQLLNHYLTPDRHKGLHKIFAFGSTGLHALFTGVPLRDLTGNSALNDLFGLTFNEVQILMKEMMLDVSRQRLFLRNFGKTCRQYIVFNETGKLSHAAYYPHEVLRHLFLGEEISPPMHDIADQVRQFVGTKLNHMGHFVRPDFFPASRKLSIDPAHLLDDSTLSPALLESLSVDFGLYKASYSGNERGYVPHNANLRSVSDWAVEQLAKLT